MYKIPDALAPLTCFPNFIIVRLAPRHGSDAKLDKFPVHPITLCDHNAHDPTVHMPYADALNRLATLGAGWCLGFVLTASIGVVCVDLDECATLSGTWSDHALTIMREFPGAIELSLSGRGLHLWAFASHVPEHAKKINKHRMELYSDRRFIALGGDATGTMCDVTAILPAFIDRWFPPVATVPAANDAIAADAGVLSDDEVINRALTAMPKINAAGAFGDDKPRATFAQMWFVDVEALRIAWPPLTPGKLFDASEVDYAIARELLYWTGKDCARVERLMRANTKLYRSKWDSHRNYLAQLTIARANAGQPNYYKARSDAITVPSAVGGIIGRAEIEEFFKGCIYTQDENKILPPDGDLVDHARFTVRYGGHLFALDELGEKFSRDPWDAFVNNQMVRLPRAQGTAFDPLKPFQSISNRSGRKWVNVYVPAPTDARRGDVTIFRDMVKRMLPVGDDALILESYMKAIVQHIGYKWRWALFLQGMPGNGKGTVINIIKRALGERYIFMLKPSMIDQNFNAYLEYNVLYIADDCYVRKDRDTIMDYLRTLITERDHAVTYKGIDSVVKRICGNWLFVDNHKDALQKTLLDRRFANLYCAQQMIGDRERDHLHGAFFRDEMYPWLERGGYEALTYWLKHDPIDPRYNPTIIQEAPKTSATEEALMHGRTGLENEIYDLILNNKAGFRGDFVSESAVKRAISGTSSQRFATRNKIRETLERLGYRVHPTLISTGGRTPIVVHPDNERTLLFVRAGSFAEHINDAHLVANMYQDAQIKGDFTS